MTVPPIPLSPLPSTLKSHQPMHSMLLIAPWSCAITPNTVPDAPITLVSHKSIYPLICNMRGGPMAQLTAGHHQSCPKCDMHVSICQLQQGEMPSQK